MSQAGKKSPQNDRLRQGEGAKKKAIDPKLLIRESKQGGIGVIASLAMCANGVGTLQFAAGGVKINQAASFYLAKSVYHLDMKC